MKSPDVMRALSRSIALLERRSIRGRSRPEFVVPGHRTVHRSAPVLVVHAAMTRKTFTTKDVQAMAPDMPIHDISNALADLRRVGVIEVAQGEPKQGRALPYRKGPAYSVRLARYMAAGKIPREP